MTCYNMGMDLSNYIITEDTPDALLPILFAYRPHTPIPSKQQMLQARYELDGHLTMKALAKDVGVNLEDKVK